MATASHIARSGSSAALDLQLLEQARQLVLHVVPQLLRFRVPVPCHRRRRALAHELALKKFLHGFVEARPAQSGTMAEAYFEAEKDLIERAMAQKVQKMDLHEKRHACTCAAGPAALQRSRAACVRATVHTWSLARPLARCCACSLWPSVLRIGRVYLRAP